MSFRTYTIERPVRLPDGREGSIRLGLADDSYIPRREEDTVVLELAVDGRIEATLNTILDVEQEGEGAQLVREIVEKLERGELAPTAGALEPYADRLP